MQFVIEFKILYQRNINVKFKSNKMRKVSLLIALFVLCMMGKVRADEGMWLPMFVERLNYVDMQKWVFS